MIGKAPGTGSGFRGVVNYLMLGKRDEENPARVAWAETRNLLTDDPDRAPAHMRATAAQSQRCKKPVYHFVISWREDENPTADLMRLIGDNTLSDLGLTDHQALLIAHNDTDHRHLHIVVNRVHPETSKAWATSKDWERLEVSLGRQAMEHDLLFVPGRFNTRQGDDRPRRVRDGEHQQARKEKRPTPNGKWSDTDIKQWREALGADFDTARSWDQLSAKLAGHGLRLERKGQGLIIANDDGHMKLSDLGKEIRLGKLQSLYAEKFSDFSERAARHPILASTSPEQQDVGAETLRPHQHRAKLTPITPHKPDKKPADEDDHKDAIADTLKAIEEDRQQQAEEETDRLRREAREARIAAREAAITHQKARIRPWQSDDSSVNEHTMSPSPTSSASSAAPPATPRAATQAKLSEAHASLAFAKALHGLGFISDSELNNAQDEVARADEEHSRHLTFHEYVEEAVGDALTSLGQIKDDRKYNDERTPEDDVEPERDDEDRDR